MSIFRLWCYVLFSVLFFRSASLVFFNRSLSVLFLELEITIVYFAWELLCYIFFLFFVCFGFVSLCKFFSFFSMSVSSFFIFFVGVIFLYLSCLHGSSEQFRKFLSFPLILFFFQKMKYTSTWSGTVYTVQNLAGVYLYASFSLLSSESFIIFCLC